VNTRRTLTFDHRSYTIARLTDEQGHSIFGPLMTIFGWDRQLACACLNNAGNGLHTVEELAAALTFRRW